MITILHNPNFNHAFYAGLPDVIPDLAACVKVAEVTTDDLEAAWELTNNVTGSWSSGNNKKVKVFNRDPDRYGHRSTSVGDIAVTANNVFVCASEGWMAIGEFSAKVFLGVAAKRREEIARQIAEQEAKAEKARVELAAEIARARAEEEARRAKIAEVVTIIDTIVAIETLDCVLRNLIGREDGAVLVLAIPR